MASRVHLLAVRARHHAVVPPARHRPTRSLRGNRPWPRVCSMAWRFTDRFRHRREFIRVLGREERVSVIAEESSPRGAYNASTYVLHRCGGCRWMPPLERA